MYSQEKISPLFELLLGGEGADVRREGIIVYQAPAMAPRVRGRLGRLRQRLQTIRNVARGQPEARNSLVSGYAEIASAHLGTEKIAEPTAIGGSSLPVAKVEITGRMLPDLATRPDVLAIM